MTRHTVGTREEWRTARCSVADGPLLVGPCYHLPAMRK